MIADEVDDFVEATRANASLDEADIAWIAAVAEQALAAGERPSTYVHCDYKLNNLTVTEGAGGGWRVSGLFDLHEARFADGALDIVRTACSYLDTVPQLAGVFVRSYLERVAPDPRLAELMPLYVVNDRMKFWEFFTRPEQAGWPKGRTFRTWTKSYLQPILMLLEAEESG
jgi:aminoglycoside/choline kinase family phosphotransferase